MKLYYANIDFCGGEYVIIFFKQKTYSPSVRGEYVFCLKNIITYSPNNKKKSIFVLLFLLSDDNYAPDNLVNISLLT